MAFDNTSHIPASTARAQLFAFPSLLPSDKSTTWLYSTLAILGSLLMLEQVVYRYKKRHLPGSSWTIPIIGKFADSVNPSMEGYKRQWNSGALSAISVFNMYVYLQQSPYLTYRNCSFIVMASSTEYSRKILNSPAYAEPCLVHSAKQVLCKENWYASSYLQLMLLTFGRVFLTGKEHVDYRRGLNGLFTRKALGYVLTYLITRQTTHCLIACILPSRTSSHGSTLLNGLRCLRKILPPGRL